MATEQKSAPKMPSSFSSIDYLKIPVFDRKKTADFYTTLFPFTYQKKWEHFTPEHKLFAVMVTHDPTNLIVEFRHVPEQAEAQRGWDPITWGVDNRNDLEPWAAWLDHHDVKRSKIFTGIKGWVMAAEDPDGKIIKLYVQQEDHEWPDHPDQDEYWLGVVKA
jgi:catechol-2,3-dioxygenase